MIITLEPDAGSEQLLGAIETLVRRFHGIDVKSYHFQGASQRITEVHLVGDTQHVPTEAFASLPGVRSVVRVSARYRLIGRPAGNTESAGFTYNGVQIGGGRPVTVCAGLCAVDTRDHVAEMMRALADQGLDTTRMGVYKPRTSPYDFQGLGKECMPWLFELAGKHGIRMIAIEVCDARHVEEVATALQQSGGATGVMLQIGTRNAQNFELLKRAGQERLPVLYKRGMGLTLEESLNACEYVASEGNLQIVLGLRGVKSHLSEPHRNLVDFAHVPVVHRRTRLPVCIDPSHSVGSNARGLDGLPEIFHAVGQGVIAGADMVLVEFHPDPPQARCDGHQALELRQLPKLLEYVRRVRRCYEELVALGG